MGGTSSHKRPIFVTRTRIVKTRPPPHPGAGYVRQALCHEVADTHTRTRVGGLPFSPDLAARRVTIELDGQALPAIPMPDRRRGRSNPAFAGRLPVAVILRVTEAPRAPE